MVSSLPLWAVRKQAFLQWSALVRPVGITTQNPRLRELFDEERAPEEFKNFSISTNNELKVFPRTSGVDDVHKLSVSDLVTDSRVVAEYAGIDHV